MVAFNKTVDNSALIAFQDIATATQVRAEFTVTTKISAEIYMEIGRRSGSAFTAGYPVFIISTSPKSTDNDWWIPRGVFAPYVGASIANTTLNGAVSAGAATFTVTSATNITVGDILFLGHTTDVSKYEICKVKAISGTTVTPQYALKYAHDNGAPVTDQAEQFSCVLSLDANTRVEVMIDNAGSGQTIAAEVRYSTLDTAS